ncbi:MAG: hypothetical protein Q7U94_09900 [Sideroxyarcus sp.]|nr:hypothetical protein [Sideroxyarcus sp.]
MTESKNVEPNITEGLTFPLNETYIAFGDGSVNSAGAFYGLVLIPESAINQVQELVSRIKLKYGGELDTPIHCREIYSGHARRKSGWSHLSEGEAVALCGDILRALLAFEPKYLLGYIPSTCYPKRFRLVGKNGHRDLVHDIDDKWLTLWSYFRVAALLDPIEIIEPDDPITTPRPKNLPFWQMVIRRQEPGLRVRNVFLDREQTKVSWFSKSFQWTSVAKELVIENLAGRSHLPVETACEEKHPLLEVADIFVYSVARSFSDGKPLEYQNFSAEVHVELILGIGEEIVLGGGNASTKR